MTPELLTLPPPPASYDRFCPTCGTPHAAAIPPRFSQAQDEYYRLKGQTDLGHLTREQFEARLQDLAVQDAQGRFWVPGMDTGEWYVSEGGKWVRGTPPPETEEPSPAILYPGLRPDADGRGAPSSKRMLLAAMGFIVLAIAIGAALLVNLKPPPGSTVAGPAITYVVVTGVAGEATALPSATPVSLAFPVLTPTVAATRAPTLPAATTIQTPSPVTLDGVWASNFGPVTLQCGAAQTDGRLPVTGSWAQADGQKGTLSSGTYDPAPRLLTLNYFQPWNNVSGQATFTLSTDGNTLKGTFKQTNGQGDWTMQRGAAAQATGTRAPSDVNTASAVSPTKPANTTTAPPPSITPAPTRVPPTLSAAPAPTNTLAPVPTNTPSYPPGVYVTALRPDPAEPKRGQGVTFIATFVNSTGTSQAYTWLVQIYDANTNKRSGETAASSISVPPGTTEWSTPNNWQVNGAGGCVSFYAQALSLNADKNRIPFNAIGGDPLSVGFQVCPAQ